VLTTKRPEVAILIGKSGKVDNAIIAPNNRTDIGDIINYTFVVSNPGIIDLTNVIVADTSIPDLTRGIDVTGNNDDTLDAGEIWSYSASYTITEANIVVGVVVNYASVTATQPNGDMITDDVTSPVLLQTAGSGILQLVPTENGKGVTVVGPEGQGLWVELTVVGAQASLQNSLNVLRLGARLESGGSSERAQALGSAPIAPEPGVLGGKRYVFLQSGQELQFTQSTGQLPTVLDPTLTVSGNDPQILLNLYDGGGGPDADFNDLVVNIRSVDFTPDADYVMGRIQSDATAGFLDLTGEAANGIELTLESFSELDNILSFVKIDIDPDNITGGAFSVGGVTPDQGQAFRDAVAANLVDFSLDLGGNGSSTTAFWDPAESGLYAPVLLTGNGDLLTFGPSGTADGLAHLKVLGQNKFGFEDLLASQGSDWDFNDLLLTAQVA
jgi:uncharacterized repeat protein (TIGR01451 family)